MHQSCTVKYRGLQGYPCNENMIPAMRTEFPVIKTGFSLWELTYREFPVSLAGLGFAVQPLLYMYCQTSQNNSPNLGQVTSILICCIFAWKDSAPAVVQQMSVKILWQFETLYCNHFYIFRYLGIQTSILNFEDFIFVQLNNKYTSWI